MSFWKSETKEAPRPEIMETDWQKESRGILEQIMRGEGGDFPQLDVAGMTDIEKGGQSLLAKILGGGAFEDPSKSLLYRGLRDESYADEERGVSGLRRRQNMGGMFVSAPGGREEAEFRGRAMRGRSSILGGLFESERNRDNPYTRMAAVGQYGSLPREITDARNMAKYGSEMGGLDRKDSAMSQLLGYAPWYQPQFYQEESGISGLANLAGGIGGAFMGSDLFGSLFKKKAPAAVSGGGGSLPAVDSFNLKGGKLGSLLGF